jgi:hypothetical protein
LTRFRGKQADPAKAFPANSFNPNKGKDWKVDTDGARFNPFPVAAGGNVQSIYAATSYTAAALASVVTSKAANGGQGKSGQRKRLGTRLFYPAASC